MNKALDFGFAALAKRVNLLILDILTGTYLVYVALDCTSVSVAIVLLLWTVNGEVSFALAEKTDFLVVSCVASAIV